MKACKKHLIALAATMASFGAMAQIDQAVKDSREALEHRSEQLNAERKAADSGPIGKAVNNTKAEYHKKMAEHHQKEAAKELKGAIPGAKTPTVVDKAENIATDAKDALAHRKEQRAAEEKAAQSGPVGKVVNKAKAQYHEGMAEHNEREVKEALDGKRVPKVIRD